MSMRVLFLTTYFPRPLNPMMGPWALKQAQALARNGVDLRVVSHNPWVPKFLARSSGAKAYALVPARYVWDDLPVEYPRWLNYPIPPISKWSYRKPQKYIQLAWWSARRNLLRVVAEHKPQVIFAHHTITNGHLAWRLNRMFGIPYVITDHDYGEIADCERWPKRFEIFQKIMASSSLMIGVSNRMTQDTLRLFPGVRATTIHNGTDPIPEEIINNPRPPTLQGKLVIFTAAMFSERKGLPLLIQAFARIAAAHPTAILRIGGDGDRRPEIEKAIADSSMAGRVELLGKLEHKSVLQEMAWSDFFALVGWDEPFATVFIESMSAGKPIVCANDGGINDVIQDNVHGYTVQPRDVESAADALNRMCSDPAARQRMGLAAMDLFRTRLNWNANARRMIHIFETAVQEASAK